MKDPSTCDFWGIESNLSENIASDFILNSFSTRLIRCNKTYLDKKTLKILLLFYDSTFIYLSIFNFIKNSNSAAAQLLLTNNLIKL